jgi:hypothetical protein
MLELEKFLSGNKSLLIAPAGYGKTHTIAQCIVRLQNSGRQLVLTHTHAGVASLKEKISKQGVPSKSFNVETISSFAQRYVLSFSMNSAKYQVDAGGEVFSEIIRAAVKIFKIKPVRNILRCTYSNLFVDEYQDCTASQHELISVLAETLNTRIFGDPMQGIFGFKGEMTVDMDNESEMKEYADNRFELDTPQRWIQGNNQLLGDDLAEIRGLLKERREIVMKQYPSIETMVANALDIYDSKSRYNRKMWEILKQKNVLIIHPEQTSINPRLKIVKNFNGIIALVESIDDKDFYRLAKNADAIALDYTYKKLYSMMCKLFNKTGMNDWFNLTGIKKKRSPDERKRSDRIALRLETTRNGRPYSWLEEILNDVSTLKGMKCYRRDLLKSLIRALRLADCEKINAEEAMTRVRNHIRRYGRRLEGRCIGTTLLTKGLESEAVVILDAHKIKCPKNFYVAITRAVRKLYVFTETDILYPYS